jgi:hypothetical protein
VTGRLTFATFCAMRGIKHLTIVPCHPQSNGLAERFVQSLKTGFDKLRRIRGWRTRLHSQSATGQQVAQRNRPALNRYTSLHGSSVRLRPRVEMPHQSIAKERRRNGHLHQQAHQRRHSTDAPLNIARSPSPTEAQAIPKSAPTVQNTKSG